LPGLLKRTAFDSLRAYLEQDRLGLKRFQLAARIARVFDQYQVYRPEMILQWEKDRLYSQSREQRWQFELWREITETKPGLDRASLREEFFEWVNDTAGEKQNLPQRVCVFGISSLPRFHLEIFAALGRLIEVNLFLVKPSFALSSSGAEKSGQAGNSLLAYMGTLGREFFTLIEALFGEAEALFHDPDESALLTCLQSDILHNRSRDGTSTPRKTIEKHDNSIQVHVCHNALREIEVLRDSLLSMFEQDPGLCPGDILVMTPQIEAYAPYIQAVFDTPEQDRIPFSIADRSLRGSSPIIDTFLAMLDLGKGRFGASEVLVVLENEAVKRKFALTDADLQLVRQWIEQTRIKWGIDARHRGSLGLPEFEENTWQAGLDRLLLGYAMAGHGERMFQGILPYDDIEGARTQVLGQLIEFMRQLFEQVNTFDRPRLSGEWAAGLAAMLDRFFEPDEETQGEVQLIREVLDQMAAEGEQAGYTGKVGLEVIRYWLSRKLEQRISGSGFITGGVTFCSMVPMRSIGFKVICLVGINDESFPRQSETSGFDLMASSPKAGDPSRRNEDRYLFMEAILAAEKKLHISYIGRSDQDNSSIPPSVVVSELLDCIERGFIHPEKNILEHVLIRHRLQAFNPDYFRSETDLFSYSEQSCRAGAQSLKPRKTANPFIVSTLSAPGEEFKTLEIDDLCAFFAHPVRFLFNRRLGIYLDEGDKLPEEREAFDLAQLEKYLLKNELAKKGLKARELPDFYLEARAAGRLPHGAMGKYFYQLTGDEVKRFLEVVHSFSSQDPLEPVEVNLELEECRIIGRLGNIYREALLRFRPTGVKPKDRLRTWVHHLLLGTIKPEGYPDTSVFLGHDRQCKYSPVANGRELLAGLARFYLEGLTRPWKLFPEASWSFARAVVEEKKTTQAAMLAARSDWRGSEHKRGDLQDPYMELCFGRTESPLDEQFQRAALAVYTPLLEHREENRL
jgi:exodeoxyribonuclease V gamma subunit